MLLEEFTPKSFLEVKRTYVPVPRFPVVDMHTHFGKLMMGDNFDTMYDTAQVVKSLQERGVRRVVNLDFGFGETRNRLLKKQMGFEDFFVNFGTVDVQRFEEAGFEEMVYRSITEGVRLGMRGLKLWKPIGLGFKDKKGSYLRPDDPRLSCIFQTAAEYKIPVLFHIADPVAFFSPVDGRNERYEELSRHPDWSFCGEEFYTFQQLMEMQENMIASNPNTKFIIAHFGSYSENLKRVGEWLDRYPNMYVDIAARISELGRQPYSSKAFLEKYCDRVFFGTDFSPNSDVMHPNYYRFLETDDEYFNPEGDGAPYGQGRWCIYGIFLSGKALNRIYHENAEEIFGF